MSTTDPIVIGQRFGQPITYRRSIYEDEFGIQHVMDAVTIPVRCRRSTGRTLEMPVMPEISVAVIEDDTDLRTLEPDSAPSLAQSAKAVDIQELLRRVEEWEDRN